MGWENPGRREVKKTESTRGLLLGVGEVQRKKKARCSLPDAPEVARCEKWKGSLVVWQSPEAAKCGYGVHCVHFFGRSVQNKNSDWQWHLQQQQRAATLGLVSSCPPSPFPRPGSPGEEASAGGQGSCIWFSGKVQRQRTNCTLSPAFAWLVSKPLIDKIFFWKAEKKIGTRAAVHSAGAA